MFALGKQLDINQYDFGNRKATLTRFELSPHF